MCLLRAGGGGGELGFRKGCVCRVWRNPVEGQGRMHIRRRAVGAHWTNSRISNDYSVLPKNTHTHSISLLMISTRRVKH